MEERREKCQYHEELATSIKVIDVKLDNLGDKVDDMRRTLYENGEGLVDKTKRHEWAMGWRIKVGWLVIGTVAASIPVFLKLLIWGQ